jgi:hypothetical protein
MVTLLPAAKQAASAMATHASVSCSGITCDADVDAVCSVDVQVLQSSHQLRPQGRNQV